MQASKIPIDQLCDMQRDNRPTSDIVMSNATTTNLPGKQTDHESDTDYIFTKTIDVLVGPEGKEVPFVIHPALICTNCASRYLQAYTSSALSHVGPVKLPHIDPPTFEKYLAWIYGGSLLAGSSQFDLTVLEYIVADQLNDLATMNHIMDEMVRLHERTGHFPPHATIRQAYQWLPQNSPMLEFMVDIHVFHAQRALLDTFTIHLPEDLLLKVYKGLESMANFPVTPRNPSKLAFVVGIRHLALFLQDDDCKNRRRIYRNLLKFKSCRYHYHDAKYTRFDHGCPKAQAGPLNRIEQLRSL